MKVYHDNGEGDFDTSLRYLKWLLSNMKGRYNILKLDLRIDGGYTTILGIRENEKVQEQFMIILSSIPINGKQKKVIENFLNKCQVKRIG
jgi:hypothetical protein